MDTLVIKWRAEARALRETLCGPVIMASNLIKANILERCANELESKHSRMLKNDSHDIGGEA